MFSRLDRLANLKMAKELTSVEINSLYLEAKDPIYKKQLRVLYRIVQREELMSKSLGKHYEAMRATVSGSEDRRLLKQSYGEHERRIVFEQQEAQLNELFAGIKLNKEAI